MIKKDGFAMIRLKQVFRTGLKMKMIDEQNTLLSTCNKEQIMNLGSMKIYNDDINKTIKVSYRRDKFDRSLILV